MKSSIFSIMIVLILGSIQCMSQDAPLFTESDTTLANEYFARADTLAKKAQYDSSVFYYEKAGVIYQKLGERFDTTTLWEKYVECLNSIGNNLRKMADYEKAMEFLEKALEIGLDKFNKNHIVMSKCYDNIGVFFDNTGDYDKALEYHHKSLTIRLKILKKNHPDIAKNYNNIGNAYYGKGDYKKSLKYDNKALALRLTLFGENHPKVADSYNNIGIIYKNNCNYAQALECHNKSLTINLKLLGKNHRKVSINYHNIGLVYFQKGDYDQALEYYNKSLVIAQSLLGNNHPNIASRYNNIGTTYLQKGDYDKAFKYCKIAASMRLEFLGENHPSVAASYNNIGIIYEHIGNFDKALEYHKKSLTLRLELFGEEHPAVSSNYNNIGVVYDSKGDYDNALEYYNKALAISLKLFGENHPEVARSYNNIAGVYDTKGDYDAALKYYNKSLKIGIKLQGENHKDVAAYYNNIGFIYKNKDDLNKALEFYQKSLAIFLKSFGENHPDVANSYSNIGVIYEKEGDYDKAYNYFKKSLVIRNKIFLENHPEVAKSYIVLGELFYKQNDLEKALSYFQKSIIALIPAFEDTNIYVNPSLEKIIAENHLLISLELKAKALRKLYSEKSHNLKDIKHSLATSQLASELIDKMRSGYQAEGSKLFLGEKASKIYEQSIQTALKLFEVTQKQEITEQAFRFTEKSKSAVLLASLQDSRARHLAGIPDSVIEREKELKIDLAFYDTQIQKESQKKDDLDSLKLRDFENRYFALNTQYQKLIEEIETIYPKYYDLKYQTQTACIPELQQTLDDKTTLVEYFLGDSTLFIFTISKDEFDVIALPTDSTLLQLVETLNKSIKKVKAKPYLAASYQVYQRLIKPVEDKIAGKERLVVIPHGILHKIPFEALITKQPTPTDRTDFTRLDYLINRFEISYHYSATLYLNSLPETGQPLAGANKPAKEFLGFAPVFSDDKNNGYILASNFPEIDLALADADVRAVNLDGKRFRELKHSKKEVEQIVKLFEKDRKNAVGYFHTNASEEIFKASAGDYQYVHIATHGFINEDKPQLSGVIFSQPTDSTDTEDGILYAGETYNLNLKADLVVLSSCESGIGKLVRGEGLMALTRGFLYSGASNIIVSLWKVPDKETGELMVAFYKSYLGGKSYAQALRQAKLKMIEKAETAFPKSWSSFVLIGR